jgi:predicted nucleic acid-binding protein
MDKVLIDTDVLLDFYLDRRPFSEFSSRTIALCELKEINGFVTPVIISNLYYLLRRNATHQKVISKISELLSFIDVLAMDKNVILNALKSDFRDFEDGLQHSSALANGLVNIILTRNTKDYKTSELSVMTPETYVLSRPTV